MSIRYVYRLLCQQLSTGVHGTHHSTTYWDALKLEMSRMRLLEDLNNEGVLCAVCDKICASVHHRLRGDHVIAHDFLCPW